MLLQNAKRPILYVFVTNFSLTNQSMANVFIHSYR